MKPSILRAILVIASLFLFAACTTVPHITVPGKASQVEATWNAVKDKPFYEGYPVYPDPDLEDFLRYTGLSFVETSNEDNAELVGMKVLTLDNFQDRVVIFGFSPNTMREYNSDIAAKKFVDEKDPLMNCFGNVEAGKDRVKVTSTYGVSVLKRSKVDFVFLKDKDDKDGDGDEEEIIGIRLPMNDEEKARAKNYETVLVWIDRYASVRLIHPEGKVADLHDFNRMGESKGAATARKVQAAEKRERLAANTGGVLNQRTKELEAQQERGKGLGRSIKRADGLIAKAPSPYPYSDCLSTTPPETEGEDPNKVEQVEPTIGEGENKEKAESQLKTAEQNVENLKAELKGTKEKGRALGKRLGISNLVQWKPALTSATETFTAKKVIFNQKQEEFEKEKGKKQVWDQCTTSTEISEKITTMVSESKTDFTDKWVAREEVQAEVTAKGGDKAPQELKTKLTKAQKNCDEAQAEADYWEDLQSRFNNMESARAEIEEAMARVNDLQKYEKLALNIPKIKAQLETAEQKLEEIRQVLNQPTN